MSAFLAAPFVLSAPAAGATTCAVCGLQASSFAPNTTGLPVGREALVRLGGVRPGAKASASGLGEFDMDKIVIPVGITPATLKKWTLYQILGFSGDLGAAADTEVIKKAYHKAVLMYHPDKAQFKTKDGKEDRSVFLKIQEAFAVLTSEPKRRAYDSQLPFDEKFPTQAEIDDLDLKTKPHRFFKKFDPVFKRNARFSAKKPVPDLGNDETPISQVYKFYEFWNKFESWRDFTGIDAEYKPDDAGSRDEKRYMQKENEKKAKELKRKEMQRIIELVSVAEKNDPRIVREKEARQQAKDKSKNDKEAAAAAIVKLETDSKAWSDALEASANGGKTLSKEEKEKLKKAQSKARNTFRKLIRTTATLGLGGDVNDKEYGRLTEKQVDLLCNSVEMEELNDLNSAMGGEAAAKETATFSQAGLDSVLATLARVSLLDENVKEDELIVRETKKREMAERNTPSPRKNKDPKLPPTPREWSAELKAVLALAVERYRPGSAQVIDSKPVSRWVSISNYVNYKLKQAEGDPVTPDEALQQAYLLANPV